LLRAPDREPLGRSSGVLAGRAFGLEQDFVRGSQLVEDTRVQRFPPQESASCIAAYPSTQ
jgi:hypothetical protein